MSNVVMFLLGLAAIVGIIYIITRSDNAPVPDEIRKKYLDIIKEINANTQKQINEEIQQQTDIVYEQVKIKSAECQEKLQILEKVVAAKENNLHEQEKNLSEKEQHLNEKLQQLYQEKAKEEASALQNIIEYYSSERRRIEEEYEQYSLDTAAQRKTIETELEKAKAKQQEIIDQFKRAEQIRQDKDFYRIVLDENSIDDVRKLRKIAQELHNPTILYKLIYKEYYEKPFNEMIGRVVTGRGSIGVYKITNINDGRTYIGQTRQTFKERWRTHLKRGVKAEPGTQNKLYDAMWKEGPENFTFEVLAECEATDLNTKEKEYISIYQGNTWGYNSTSGGA